MIAPRRSPEVAVVGGGLAGLAAAVTLLELGHEVTVFEAGDRVGGVVRTRRERGFVAELGPHSMATPAPPAWALLDTLGLRERILAPSPAAKRRFVVRNARPIALPSSPGSLLKSELLSARGKLRLLAEPLVGRGSEPDESVASFVTRRLGAEALAYLADPFVAGIFAGDPERLSVRHALPKVHRLTEAHGSLFRGALAAMRERARSDRAPATFSFPTGMAEIPEACAELLGDRIRLRRAVTGLSRELDHWRLSTTDDADGPRAFDAVVLAVPAYTLASLAWHGVDDSAFRPLGRVRYVPVASLTLGFPEAAIAGPLDGFGMLVPRAEERRILGTVFASSLFGERAPEGHVTLATLVGGARKPGLALAGDTAVRTAVLADLQALLGVRGEPVFECFHCWPKAIPQYELGHDAISEAIDRVERESDRLAIAGSFRDGPSVGDTLLTGIRAAERVAAQVLDHAVAVPA